MGTIEYGLLYFSLFLTDYRSLCHICPDRDDTDGVRTREHVSAVVLKTTPLDQLGHSVMMYEAHDEHVHTLMYEAYEEHLQPLFLFLLLLFFLPFQVLA
jgi:hypothetical protein